MWVVAKMPGGGGDEVIRNWKVQVGGERSWIDCLLKGTVACVLKEIVQVQRSGERAGVLLCAGRSVASGAGKVRAERACQ